MLLASGVTTKWYLEKAVGGVKIYSRSCMSSSLTSANGVAITMQSTRCTSMIELIGVDGWKGQFNVQLAEQ
jgi:hypothetical protein